MALRAMCRGTASDLDHSSAADPDHIGMWRCELERRLPECHAALETRLIVKHSAHSFWVQSLNLSGQLDQPVRGSLEWGD
jgi:hypothetical protein